MVDAAGAIYVIGGYYESTFQDVWASTDGGARPASVKGGAGGGVLEGDTLGGTRGYSRGYSGVLRRYSRVAYAY